MADVFISYAREDQALAQRLTEALESEGFSVWWDHTIPPGKTWNTFIARGIEDAKACVVVWSEHAVASKWVMEEATLANDREKLLPISIDGALPPMGFRSMQSAQLQGWSGDRDNPQWRMLVQEIRRAMGDTVATRPQPRAAQSTSAANGAPFLARLPPAVKYAAVALLAAGAVWIVATNEWLSRAQPGSAQPPEIGIDNPAPAEGASSDSGHDAVEGSVGRINRLERDAKASGIEGVWYHVDGDASLSCGQYGVESFRPRRFEVIRDRITGGYVNASAQGAWAGNVDYRIDAVSGREIGLDSTRGPGRALVSDDTVRFEFRSMTLVLRRCPTQ